MSFRMEIHSTPLRTEGMDPGSIIIPFLVSVGYFPQGYEQKVNMHESVPYRIFTECFIKKKDKVWTMGEIARHVNTSIPTVYRHVEKLKEMDIICEYSLKNNPSRKGLAMRYFNISDAWKFTELNVKMTLKKYRDVVDHISTHFPPKENEDVERLGGFRPVEFSIQLTDSIKISDSIERTVLNFLVAVGYIGDLEDGKTKAVRRSIPYKLFRDCLIADASRMWAVENLARELKTTKPTVYRHLRKLECLGIMEKVVSGGKGRAKKSYRIRHGNLSKAWNTTEEYVNIHMKKYKEVIDAINEIMEG